MSRWPEVTVPEDIPTVVDLVRLGHAHEGEVARLGTVYVVHPEGHALLGELLRARGRR